MAKPKPKAKPKPQKKAKEAGVREKGGERTASDLGRNSRLTLSNTARSPADRWSGGSGPLPSASLAAGAAGAGLESRARSAEEGGVVGIVEKFRLQRRLQRDGTVAAAGKVEESRGWGGRVDGHGGAVRGRVRARARKVKVALEGAIVRVGVVVAVVVVVVESCVLVGPNKVPYR